MLESTCWSCIASELRLMLNLLNLQIASSEHLPLNQHRSFCVKDPSCSSVQGLTGNLTGIDKTALSHLAGIPASHLQINRYQGQLDSASARGKVTAFWITIFSWCARCRSFHDHSISVRLFEQSCASFAWNCACWRIQEQPLAFDVFSFHQALRQQSARC
jgi:hypothetical protein